MKRNIKVIVTLCVIIFILVGVAIGVNNIGRKPGETLIVATNFPAYDFARAVAGDTADIKMLVKPGAETHDFEPSPQDIIDINNSRLFIFTGGESDEWINGVLSDLGADKTRLFKMMDSVDTREEETVDGMEEDGDEYKDADKIEYDEHVWTSLKNAAKIVSDIKDALIEISPENKNYYESNAKNYIDKLNELDLEFRQIVDNSSRRVIVFGDRFPLRYFADDYELDYYAAFPGCSEQTEASSKTIAFLIDKIRAENIPVVFKVEMSKGSIAQAVAEETGAKILTFDTAHNISADDFKSGRTYADIMKDNLAVLREALK